MNKQQKLILLIVFILVLSISLYFILFYNQIDTNRSSNLTLATHREIENSHGEERESLIKEYGVRTNKIDLNRCDLNPAAIYMETQEEDVIFTNSSDEPIRIEIGTSTSYFIEPQNELPIRLLLGNDSKKVFQFVCFALESRWKFTGYILIDTQRTSN